METLWTSKKFIIISTVFVGLMCVFTIVGILKTNKELSNNYQNAISFNGHGEVKAVPDIATFSLTIRQEAKTVKESDAKVVVVEKKVLDFLKTKNISDKDIKVENTSFNPKYENKIVMPCNQFGCPQNNPVITGYESFENMTVKVRNVDDAGAVKQGIGALGVENLSGPNFSIDDTDILTDQARKLAIDNAKTKAEKLAKDLGINLGKIISFNENGNSPMPMMYAKADFGGASEASAPAVLPKGENTITSDVTITYEIK